MRHLPVLVVLLAAATVLAVAEVSFLVSPSVLSKPFPHFWERCVGSGHASLALREDYRKQLADSQAHLGWQYIRFHAILNDDMSVVIGDDTGGYQFSFYNVDQIYDFLLSINMRPIVELSFMPSMFASGNQTVFYYDANITPPKNYSDWDALVTAFAEHMISRYGIDEVSQWYFEVWNEPQCGFWSGDQTDYFTLLQHTVTAIHNVDRRLRVGGPATCQSGWIPETLAFAQQAGIHLDFVSTHEYPTDPYHGNPRTIMKDVFTAIKLVADPLPLFYTEYNSGLYWGGDWPKYDNHDQPYASSYIMHFVHEVQGLADIASYWAFSDIFEEGGQDSRPFHNGYGINTQIGVPKPAYRAFELLHEMGNTEVNVTCTSTPVLEVESWAVSDGEFVWVVVYNWNYYPQPMQSHMVSVTVAGVARTGHPEVTVRYLDDNHGSAKPVWQSMGSPTYPTQDQIDTMMKASQVNAEQATYGISGNDINLQLELIPYGVAVVKVPLSYQ